MSSVIREGIALVQACCAESGNVDTIMPMVAKAENHVEIKPLIDDDRWLFMSGIGIVAWIAFLQIHVRQATVPVGMNYWSDPTVAYLYNGLNLAEGRLPHHSDHPGTPIQLGCAAVIRLIGWHRGVEHLSTDFVENLQLYERAINWCVIALFTGLQLAMFWLIHRHRGSWSALWLLAWPMLHGNVWPFAGVHSEVGLLVANQLLLMFLYTNARSPLKYGDLISGGLFALGVASKFLFAPWGLLLLLISRNRWHWAGAASATLFLLMLPALPQLPTTLSLYSDVASKGGDYGRIGHSTAPWWDMWGNLPSLSKEFGPQLLLLVVLGLCFWKGAGDTAVENEEARSIFKSRARLGLWWCAIGSLVIVLRQWHTKHLLSFAAMMGAMLWLAPITARLQWARMGVRCCAVVGFLILLFASAGHLAYARHFVQQREANEKLHRTLVSKYRDDWKIIANHYFLPSPHPLAIGHFGDQFSSPFKGASVGREVTDWLRDDLLHKAYPKSFVFDIQAETVVSPPERWTLEEVLARIAEEESGASVIVGVPANAELPRLPGYRLVPLECALNFGWFRLFRVPDESLAVPASFVSLTWEGNDDDLSMLTDERKDGDAWRHDSREELVIHLRLPSPVSITGIGFSLPKEFPSGALPFGCRIEVEGTEVANDVWQWYRSLDRFMPLTGVTGDEVTLRLSPGWGGQIAMNEITVYAVPPGDRISAPQHLRR